MELWNIWFMLVNQLESACNRKTTFFWLVTILIGMTIKIDFLGVTSIARGVGLLPCYYTCMLNFFSSNAIDITKLQHLWVHLILSKYNGLVHVNGSVTNHGFKLLTYTYK
jgi:hypothetical protein